MEFYKKKSTEELGKIVGDRKNPIARAQAMRELERRAKETPKDSEQEMDTRRLNRKNILAREAAFKVVSLLTCSSDEQKIGRFLEVYKLDLSNYNSFHLTETFKSFE